MKEIYSHNRVIMWYLPANCRMKLSLQPNLDLR